MKSPNSNQSERALILHVDPRAIGHSERILANMVRATAGLPNGEKDVASPPLEQVLKIDEIIEAVFSDTQLISGFTARSIRHVAMCGEVAKALLDIVDKADQINLLTVGTVYLPDFMQEVIDEIIVGGQKHYDALRKKYGHGYDLPATGAPEALEASFGYFDQHYNFSQRPELKEILTQNSSITAGGMRTLGDFIAGMLERAEKTSKRARFIQPDNSFDSWQNKLSRKTGRGRLADIHYIETSQTNLLHLSGEDVQKFHDEHPNNDSFSDTWYITVVGNPSGTVIEPNQLAEVCEEIIKNDPNAVIILDCVYARNLELQKTQALLQGVINNPSVFERVVILESFSKTHGICAERISHFTAPNQTIYDYMQNAVMSESAGAPRSHSGLAMALAENTPKQEAQLRRLHQFWAQERRGLWHYLRQHPEFARLFDDDQSHIREKDLKQPGTLYLFPKLKPGISAGDVLIATQCLGVETKMASGNYTRFSIGAIQKETFAQHIKEAA